MFWTKLQIQQWILFSFWIINELLNSLERILSSFTSITSWCSIKTSVFTFIFLLVSNSYDATNTKSFFHDYLISDTLLQIFNSFWIISPSSFSQICFKSHQLGIRIKNLRIIGNPFFFNHKFNEFNFIFINTK